MLPARFWRKVNKNGPIPADRPELGPCWTWSGSTTARGYGRWRVSGKTVYVFRSTYEDVHGAVPEDKELDHLCRNKSCCNPSHLEPVTHAVNCQRGDARALKMAITHCPKGHPYDEKNTIKKSLKSGGVNRVCRLCKQAQERARYHARRGRTREEEL